MGIWKPNREGINERFTVYLFCKKLLFDDGKSCFSASTWVYEICLQGVIEQDINEEGFLDKYKKSQDFLGEKR